MNDGIEIEQSQLDIMIKALKNRINNDFDAVIVFSGEEGIGKSACAYHFGKALDKQFDIERNILFQPTTKEMKDKITQLPKYSFIDVDEAIKVLYKLNWNDKRQKYLNELYSICREYNMITGLCIPRFTDLNEFFRNHRTLLWIHVYARGKAMVFKADANPFNKDPFHIKENSKKLIDMTKRNKQGVFFKITDADVNKYFSKLAGYLASFTFDDFPKEEKKRYKELKIKYSKEYMMKDEIQIKLEEQRNRMIIMLYYFLGFDMEKMSRLVGCQKPTISEVVKTYFKPTNDLDSPTKPLEWFDNLYMRWRAYSMRHLIINKYLPVLKNKFFFIKSSLNRQDNELEKRRIEGLLRKYRKITGVLKPKDIDDEEDKDLDGSDEDSKDTAESFEGKQ